MALIIVLLAITTMGRKSIYDMTLQEFKSMLCEKTTPQIIDIQGLPLIDHTQNTHYKDIVIPVSFDARKQFGKCIHPVRDQGNCGSCWAHATSESISDRFCISTNGHANFILSPQYLVSCDTYDDKCSGGFAPSSFRFMTETGTVLEECSPYQGVNGTCNATCDVPNIPYKLFKCQAGTAGYVNDTESIKIELMTYGPMYSRFEVYDDFMEYKNGIYYQTSKTLLGGHAVKLIGWGLENGIDYWLFQNSWGTDWGENGYFRIKFNEAGICKFAYRCLPDLS